MTITTTKRLPSPQVLAEVLRTNFSDRCSFHLFGLGRKTIIVRKSALLGVQITVGEFEATVDAAPPSLLAWFISLFSAAELGTVPFFFLGGGGFFSSRSKALQMEIATFLREQYS